MSDAEAEVETTFKKRNLKNKAGRKRKSSSSEDEKSDSEEQTVVLPAKRPQKMNPNVQTTKEVKETKEISEKEENGNTVDEKEEEKPTTTVSVRQQRENATATYQQDTEKSCITRTLFERAQRINIVMTGEPENNVYRGVYNFAKYYERPDTPPVSRVKKGPIRAPDNLRATVRWDYQPDICKDYKETGFCGFGDSCKFLHDRSDYKHGWQLEQEEANAGSTSGETSGQGGSNEVELPDYDSEVVPEIPTRCFICRRCFINPVITKCSHFFCESCALDHYQKKSTRCYICGLQTEGLFKPAKRLAEQLYHIIASSSDEDDDDDEEKKEEDEGE